MRREEVEIVEVLDKCRKKLQESPQLCALKPGEIQVSDFEDDIFCYWGIVAYQHVKEIASFSYEKIIYHLSEISNNGCVCNYVAYILQKEHGIRMVKLFIEAFKDGKGQRVIPFVEDNLLFESSVEIEETEDFLTVINQNKCRQLEILLSDYAKLVCIMRKQEDVFRLFMKDKEEIYFDFMSYFCREVYQIDSVIGDRMLLELLQIEKDGAEGVAVDFLDIGIYYGCHVFEQYFEKIQGWMQKKLKLREKLIPTYIVYLKKAEKEDIKKDIIVELEKIQLGTIEEKSSFLNAILSKEPLPEYSKRIFDGIVLHSFEKNGEILKLLCRYLSAQENMDDAERLQYIYQIYKINEYWSNDHDFFAQVSSMLHEIKSNQIVLVDYFIKCMFTCGIENFYFALGLYKSLIYVNGIGDILFERELSVTELIMIIRGLLYYHYDANSICLISYKLLQIIPDSIDAEPYLAVCMDEIYENYSYTYCELAKQHNNNGKWTEELTKRILETYQEHITNQKIAYSKPDLKPSMEHEQLLRKAKLEQNAKINKTARETSFFASMFSSRVMKYGKRHAGIQYSQRDGYSYLVTPYSSRKYEREIAHVYLNDPVGWYGLRRQYLKEREKYCEVNN